MLYNGHVIAQCRVFFLTISTDYIVANILHLGKSLHIGKGGTMLHNIRVLCKMKHMTLTELCRQADVEYASLMKWDRHNPNVISVYRVAKVLGTTIENLIEGVS